MSKFQEKIEHACRVYSISIEELCTTIKINPFSLHLHATGQRELDHNEMVLLCQYFDLMDIYFTNDKIRFIDVDTLPDFIRNLLPQTDKRGIMCYEVVEEKSPDMTHKEIADFLKFVVNFR